MIYIVCALDQYLVLLKKWSSPFTVLHVFLDSFRTNNTASLSTVIMGQTCLIDYNINDQRKGHRNKKTATH